MVDPEMLPKVAMIPAEPKALALTNPFEPETLLTVATPESVELQVTEAVKSCVEPSDKVPVAANCKVEPGPMVGFTGVTAIATSAFTVSVVEPETPKVAVMVVEPAATAVANPCEPEALLMEATPPTDELQATKVVKSRTEPSEKDPAAVNC